MVLEQLNSEGVADSYVGADVSASAISSSALSLGDCFIPLVQVNGNRLPFAWVSLGLAVLMNVFGVCRVSRDYSLWRNAGPRKLVVGVVLEDNLGLSGEFDPSRK